MPHYLDHNATTALRPEARQAIADAMAMTGNGSSVHAFGRHARAVIEDARDAVAALLRIDRDGVVFTSGGTEANNQAIKGSGAKRVLVSAVEHPAVKSAREDAEIIPVDHDGVVDLRALKEMLSDEAENTLVCLMLANNETGVIQPVAEAAEIVHAAGAWLHCDAVQAVGKIPVNAVLIGADTLALSGHKMGAPAGVGALVLANPNAVPSALLSGGGQEGYRRPGTENLLGIAAMGAATRAVADHGMAEAERIRELRDELEARLPDQAEVAGRSVPRLANTSSIMCAGIDSETQIMALDLAGIAVSAGAACSSGKVRKSAVLDAMGYGEDKAGAAIRVSLGWNSTPDDVDAFVVAWSKLVRQRSVAA